MARPTEAEIKRFFHDHDARIHAIALDSGQPAIVDANGVADPTTANTRWHQIALEGEWAGHYMGSFKITRGDMENAKFVFDSQSNDMAVDYEHNTYNPFALEAPAAAWIDALDIRETSQGTGLFGRFKWTKPAAARIDAGEYRYLSPTLLRSTRDRKSGKDVGFSIHTVALTNIPFLDELPEVTLSTNWLARLSAAETTSTEKVSMDEKNLIQLAAVLGLPINSTAEQAIAACSGLVADSKGIEQIACALGCEGAGVDVLVATATGLKEQNENLAIKAAQVDKIRAEQGIAKARAEGKITATNEAWAIKLANENFETFEGWAAATVPVVGPVVVTASSDSGLTGDEDQDKAKLCKNQEVIKEAKAARISVESYVAANLADLAKQYA